MATTTKALKQLSLKGLNLAVNTQIAPLWKPMTGELFTIPGVECKLSAGRGGKTPSLYLKPTGKYESVRIHLGRKFDFVQDLEEDETYNVIVQVVEPNTEISEEDLETIETSYPGSLKAYRTAVAEGHQQIRFVDIVEEE